MFQLFKTCTIHKLTHLFLSDVFETNYDQPSDEWMGWKSDPSFQFTTMIKDMVSSLMNKTSIPHHIYLISTMGTSQGGLGLLHSTTLAVPTFMLASRKCIQYAVNGVWIGGIRPPVPLPDNITSFYKNWKTSTLTPFQFSQKDLQSMVDTCVHTMEEDNTNIFLYNSSLYICRQQIKGCYSKFTKTCIVEIFKYFKVDASLS